MHNAHKSIVSNQFIITILSVLFSLFKYKFLLTYNWLSVFTADVMKLGSVGIEVNVEGCNTSLTVTSIRLGSVESIGGPGVEGLGNIQTIVDTCHGNLPRETVSENPLGQRTLSPNDLNPPVQK